MYCACGEQFNHYFYFRQHVLWCDGKRGITERPQCIPDYVYAKCVCGIEFFSSFGFDDIANHESLWTNYHRFVKYECYCGRCGAAYKRLHQMHDCVHGVSRFSEPDHLRWNVMGHYMGCQCRICDNTNHTATL